MVKLKIIKCMVGGYWLWMMEEDMRVSLRITFFMDKANYQLKIIYILVVFNKENAMVRVN